MKNTVMNEGRQLMNEGLTMNEGGLKMNEGGLKTNACCFHRNVGYLIFFKWCLQ